MIKLNNKNITYVALADTNNSTKAPKEIWYADSANSVKLVYRRKDALIEGEDYEKYHWLEGDGNTYIDTNIIPSQLDTISLKVNHTKPNSIKGIFGVFYLNTPAFAKASCFLVNYNNATFAIRYFSSQIYPESDTEVQVVMDKDEIVINGVQSAFSQYSDAPSPPYSLPLFTRLRVDNGELNYTQELYNCRISYFNIQNKLHLIPCKLLKPVPKWLDANGIRRQVGECGMIDLVSGKFYGNVNNVGTFTVENYYERKEWLVGDGSAYIDTGHNVNEDLDYETKVHLLPNTYLFWYRSGNPYYDQTMVARSDTSQYIGVRTAKNSIDVRADDTANVEVQWNNNEVLVNGVSYIPGNRAITFNYELYLFYAYLADTSITNYSSNNVKCAYFRFLDSNRNYIQNLIPCTLTMDLPASMDANGISRTKGTSGMWDLVSDRFYGNVANSGTFKAVNLAEGVDYEVHQWLVGDGAYFRIPVNVYQESLYVKFHPTSSDSNHLFWEGFYEISSDATIEIRGLIGGSNELGIRFGIRENGNATAGVLNVRNIDFLDDFTIETQYSEDNKVNFILNGTSGTATPKIDSRADVDVSVEFKTTWCRFAMVNTDRINLIPVKLLKSIPAKYDANGIARQVGECGMYDTVNDVFYGNVASSGSFSCVNDS